jgi:hypothetical protein
MSLDSEAIMNSSQDINEKHCELIFLSVNLYHEFYLLLTKKGRVITQNHTQPGGMPLHDSSAINLIFIKF